MQANALSKHFFVGPSLADTTDDPEFYFRNTVTDVPYGAAQDGLFTATYAQPVSRVKWQITETALIARQTYEQVNDSDYHGSRTTNDGQVVAMFAITSHFDVRRAYNPGTGEELNIVEENASDRPWYQREYFRVDWSSNMVTDAYNVDTLSMMGIFGGIRWQPMRYFDSDPNSPNAPLVDEADGYIDVTTKAFAAPINIDTPWGEFPACFLPQQYGGSNPYGKCDPTEVTLRLSFHKLEDHDFQPSDWTGPKMEAFGWFLQERYGFDRNYGIVDQRWHRFAAKYNIWEKSHVEGTQCAVDHWRDASGRPQNYQVDANGDFVRDPNTGLPIPSAQGKRFPGGVVGQNVHLSSDGRTEDLCVFTKADGAPVHEGSQCDEFANKCTLPMRERNLRTLPWYYGPDSPADLFASTAFALNSWNVAMKRAALLGMRADALRLGDPSHMKFDWAMNEEDVRQASLGNKAKIDELKAAGAAFVEPNIFVLCHNPVVEGDDSSCGPPGKKVRVGDIRYSMVNIVPNPQVPSPWGIMVDADDPLTGEKVATSVNEWGQVLDSFTQGAVDLVKWFNGEISDADIENGAYMNSWVQASQFGTQQFRPTVLSKADIQSRIDSVDTSIQQFNKLTQEDMQLPAPIRMEKAAKNLKAALGPSIDNKFEAMRQRLINSPFELEMLTPEQLQRAGFDPRTPIAGNSNLIAKASPLRGMNPNLRRWTERMRSMAMAKVGACMVEQPEPSGVAGLARQAAKLYPAPDRSDPNYPALLASRDKKMFQWLREQFHISVIEHEMGHSMGLRHNFTSNIDALNFHTQYWQLRTRNGKEHFCANLTQQNGKYVNGWKAKGDVLDATTPMTDGSVCVGPRWTDPLTDTEVNGLIWRWGATTVMDYPGDITQDLNDLGSYDKAALRFTYGEVADVDLDAEFDKAVVQGVGLFGQALPNNAKGKGTVYIQQLDGFGGIGGQTIGGFHYTTYADKFDVLGQCTPETDPNDPLSAKCEGFKLEFPALRDMQTVSKYGDQLLGIRPDLVSPFAVDKQNHVRHPYMFGSDEYADTGNVPVFRFDAGADAYEQMQFLISVYENRYIFDNFRRNRTTFNTNTVLSRIESRYFDKLQGMVKTLALMVQLSNLNAVKDPGNLMPLSIASTDALATFIRVLTRPEPGTYATKNPPPPSDLLNMNYAATQEFGDQINNPDCSRTPAGCFKVGLGSGQGRYLHNDYDYTQGYWWSSYQKFAGTSLEKQAVIQYLLEAYNNFVANQKEDYIDGRFRNLNFASVFPNQVRRIMSAIFQSDPMTMAPYVVIPAQMPADKILPVQYLPWDRYDNNTINLDYPANATVLDPLVGWEQQYPSLINAFMFGRTNLTMDMIDQLRVWTPNGVEGTWVAPQDQIRFRDPVSGVIYAARNYGTETVNAKAGAVQKTPGARMIQYANALAARAYTANGTVNGNDGFTYPNYNTATPANVTAAAALKGFVGNLDHVRDLGQALGFNGQGLGVWGD